MTASVSTERLSAILRSAHQRTLELVAGLSPEQLMGPKLPIVNPLLWEIGHVAWFHEQFILRREHGHAPLLERGDALYDSIAVAHDTRWDLPVYALDDITAYMEEVLETLIGRLDGPMADARDSYLYQFTTFHEDMHCEAYTWARQTLGYPAPAFRPDAAFALHTPETGPLDGDADLPGGTFAMGAPRNARFLFDNEKWAHEVTIAPFHMARAPVTNAAFAAFVDDGGYERRDLWSEAGWAWRRETGARHPVYWRPGWQMRRFASWEDLPPHRPAIHVNWYEADAWCRWAGRRLPSEAEWEFAATLRPDPDGRLRKVRFPWGDGEPTPAHANLDGYALGCTDVAAFAAGDNAWGVRQLIGNTWEWTSDTFGPFDGFSPDDYREYSEPLFGSTKVLRGGAWTTRSRMVSGTYRNYFGPDRRDVFAGFRTCALA